MDRNDFGRSFSYPKNIGLFIKPYDHNFKKY